MSHLAPPLQDEHPFASGLIGEQRQKVRAMILGKGPDPAEEPKVEHRPTTGGDAGR